MIDQSILKNMGVSEQVLVSLSKCSGEIGIYVHPEHDFTFSPETREGNFVLACKNDDVELLLDKLSGEIWLKDYSGRPSIFMNSSWCQFAACSVAYADICARLKKYPYDVPEEESQILASDLRNAIDSIDTKALNGIEAYWISIVEEIELGAV
ncbi:SUKH-4 family immunity protein [Deinococcus aquiradiocola]|uniref:Uncharacterized protein n=1 Tax=Deinococcus aquiradiocola TaxID=393059 RepID=A0A917UR36_9DEIO|nr:SUKH-4 family immunity protein [Deinococcus aquiradiocola]GGJ78592.1 hypothetical protein GCM10008939_23100 [Deinococcus aquiradiocola]